MGINLSIKLHADLTSIPDDRDYYYYDYYDSFDNYGIDFGDILDSIG